MIGLRADNPSRAYGRRPGTVLVFTVFMMVALLAMLAFAVDVGYLAVVRTESQRAADASALAGASALYQPVGSLENFVYRLPPDAYAARREARAVIRQNLTAGRQVDVDLNLSNAPAGEIVVGRFHYPADHSESLDATSEVPNTVQVRLPLTAEHANGPASLFFARVLGYQSADTGATAAATTWYPAVLPFATSEENWGSLSDGGAGDAFAYEPGQGNFGVVPGEDGLAEIVLFPGPWAEGDLPPGNFGLVQIGPDGLVLEAIRRQIDMGPSPSDMEVHEGEIRSGDQLPGRTGLKSAAKHAFLGGWADGRNYGGMLGRPRQLPLYSSVSGNGDNAVFVIARFVGVRVIALRIDGRWRTRRQDTDGDEIEAIRVQPLAKSEELVQVQLTR